MPGYWDGKKWLLIGAPVGVQEAYLLSEGYTIGEKVERNTWIPVSELSSKTLKVEITSQVTGPISSVLCYISDGVNMCSAIYDFISEQWRETEESYIFDFTPTHFQEQYIPELPKK